VLAVDEQRAGQPDRHLRDTEEVLDVAGQHGRVEGVAADVLELASGLPSDQVLPGRDGAR
jgi:hypothetical protein